MTEYNVQYISVVDRDNWLTKVVDPLLQNLRLRHHLENVATRLSD